MFMIKLLHYLVKKMTKHIQNFLKENKIPYLFDALLSEKTWIGFGGKIPFWITPENRGQFKSIILFLYKKKLPFDIVGATSNILFSETETYFCVVDSRHIRGISINQGKNILEAACGEPTSAVVRRAVEEAGATDFAGLVGIPGTIGAATINNAGARGDVIENIILQIQVIFPDGTIAWVNKQELSYKHRSSAIKRGELTGVVLAVRLEIIRGDRELELKRIQNALTARVKHQETKHKNLGSVFVTKIGLYREIAKHHLIYKIALRCSEIILSKLARLNKKLIVAKHLNRLTALFFWRYSIHLPVSQYGLNCFIKTSQTTEDDFFTYINWVKKLTKNSVPLEIEIKKSHILR